MAEGARLESVFRGNSNVGSNPTLSASQPVGVVSAQHSLIPGILRAVSVITREWRQLLPVASFGCGFSPLLTVAVLPVSSSVCGAVGVSTQESAVSRAGN